VTVGKKVPVSPASFVAVELKSNTPPCEAENCTLVMVICGLTPVQLPFGQPAAAPETVGAAVSVEVPGTVALPFLISPAGIVTGVVVGPSSILF
jgi:hypothetical protein